MQSGAQSSSPLRVILTGGHTQAVSFPHQLNQLWLWISKALLPCLLFIVPSMSVFEVHFLKSFLNLLFVSHQRHYMTIKCLHIYFFCPSQKSPFFYCKVRHLYIYTTVHMYLCHAFILTVLFMHSSSSLVWRRIVCSVTVQQLVFFCSEPSFCFQCLSNTLSSWNPNKCPLYREIEAWPYGDCRSWTYVNKK